MTTKYPWREMTEGGSFLVEKSSPQIRQALRDSGHRWLNDHNETHGHLRVIVRKEGDKACRVWMVSEKWHPSFPLCGEPQGKTDNVGEETP